MQTETVTDLLTELHTDKSKCCMLYVSSYFFFFLPDMDMKHGTIKCIIIKLAAILRKDDLFKQQRRRQACAFVWPDHSLCYLPETDMDLEKTTRTNWSL